MIRTKKSTNSEKVFDHDEGEDSGGKEASERSTEKAKKAKSAQEPQGHLQDPRAVDAKDGQDYDSQDHIRRSALRKLHQSDPLQTEEGMIEFKRSLAYEEGSKQEAPTPRGLPLTGALKHEDERRRGYLRDSDIGQPTDKQIEETGEETVRIELCPPLKTYARVDSPEIFKQEDAPFRVTVEKAKQLFALRNELHQPVFRNFRERVARTVRNDSGRIVEDVADEVPIIYRNIVKRQRPNNQASEEEVVLTQRGVVSKGRDDVDYGDVEDDDTRGDKRSGTVEIGSHKHVASVPEKARKNSGDLGSSEMKKGGGVKV